MRGKSYTDPIFSFKLGRPGTISGTHELIPHESYRLVYEIEQETVWILALVHTAKQWPLVRE